MLFRSNIAIDTGIEGAENAIDMSTVTTDKELEDAAERCNVFGRVTPAAKERVWCCREMSYMLQKCYKCF